MTIFFEYMSNISGQQNFRNVKVWWEYCQGNLRQSVFIVIMKYFGLLICLQKFLPIEIQESIM
jgi:hypothetical protein